MNNKTALQELIEKYEALPTPMNAMTQKIKYAVIGDLKAALPKEKEDMRDCFDAGQRYGQSAIFGLGVKYEPNFTIFYTTHFNNQ